MVDMQKRKLRILNRKHGEDKALKIKIKYIRDINPIEILDTGDWIDLRCGSDTWVEPGEYVQIPLGVAMELPEGYEAHVIPRSSTFRKYKILLANSMGLIDNSYCGNKDEWHFPAYATEEVKIPKNERICQFRIVPVQPKIEFEIVDKLDSPDRGGFGSTGRI